MHERPGESVPMQSDEYKLVVQYSPLCIHQIGMDGNLSSMNPAGLDMMGVTCEADVLGVPYLNSVCDDDRPAIAMLLREAMEGRTSKFTFRSNGGRVFASSFVPMRDEKGEVFSLMGLTEDVTERVRSEKRLRRIEERLTLALEASALGVWELNPRTEEMSWSKNVGPLLGLDEEDLGRTLDAYLNLADADERDAVRQRVLGSVAQPSPFVLRHCITTGHSQRLVELTGRAFADDTGAVVHLTGTIADVTERARLEEQLLQKQKLEGLGLLAGGIAHDFNNLLTGIMGNADLLSMGPLDEQARQRVADVLRSTERAAELCEKLLAYAGRSTTSPEVFDLSDLADDTVSLLQSSLAPELRVQLKLEPSAAFVRGDKTQLRQVIMNLVSNAAQAVTGTSGTVTVQTGHAEPTPEHPEQGVYVEVADGGRGMNEETRQRMFDPFFTTRVGGHGLGLAAVLGIVQAHRGSIAVESRPGEGTQIHVWFPAHVGGSPAVKGGRVDEPSSSLASRIVVVDDDPAVRKVAAQCLTAKGHGVVALEGGQQLLDWVEAHPGEAELVLLDVTMPGMSGVDAFNELIARGERIPVVMMSGFAASAMASRIRHGDLAGFIEKPFRLETLMRAVNEALRTRPDRVQ